MSSDLIKKLKKSPFTSNYATTKGVSGRMLSYFVEKGVLVRLSHGVYAFPKKLSFDYESILKEKLAQVPHSVVGMKSALKLYGLTEDDPPFIHLMVSESSATRKKVEDIKFHVVAKHLFNEGITKIRGIPVTTVERTIVDLLKRKGMPKDGRLVILEAQNKKIRLDFGEIERLATLFNVKSKFVSIMENL